MKFQSVVAEYGFSSNKSTKDCGIFSSAKAKYFSKSSAERIKISRARSSKSFSVNSFLVVSSSVSRVLVVSVNTPASIAFKIFFKALSVLENSRLRFLSVFILFESA